MNCSKCQNKTKISRTYPDMWFCSLCGIGDYLPSKNIIDIVGPPLSGLYTFSAALHCHLMKQKEQVFMFQRLQMNYAPVINGTKTLEEILPSPQFPLGSTTIVPNPIIIELLDKGHPPHSYYLKRSENNIKSKVLFLNENSSSFPEKEKKIREFYTSPGIKSLNIEFIEGSNKYLLGKF